LNVPSRAATILRGARPAILAQAFRPGALL